MQNDNDIVKYYPLPLIRCVFADELLKLDHGAFHLTPRRSRLSTGTSYGLCIGSESIAAMMECSPYPADWAHYPVLLFSSKQKHPMEYNPASNATVGSLVEFTLVVLVTPK